MAKSCNFMAHVQDMEYCENDTTLPIIPNEAKSYRKELLMCLHFFTHSFSSKSKLWPYRNYLTIVR